MHYVHLIMKEFNDLFMTLYIFFAHCIFTIFKLHPSVSSCNESNLEVVTKISFSV